MSEEERRISTQPSSSLSLQLLFKVDKYYSFFLYLIILLLFVFKQAILPYPYGRIIPEVIAMILLFIINLFRISLGSSGNKTEQAMVLLISILLGILNLVGHIYFIFLQTYVMIYDVVFSGIGLLLLALEVLISLVTMFYIKAHEKRN